MSGIVIVVYEWMEICCKTVHLVLCFQYCGLFSQHCDEIIWNPLKSTWSPWNSETEKSFNPLMPWWSKSESSMVPVIKIPAQNSSQSFGLFFIYSYLCTWDPWDLGLIITSFNMTLKCHRKMPHPLLNWFSLT